MPRLFLVALLTALSTGPALAQCTTSWINAAGGAWTDGANWDNGVPGPTDDACITLDGTYAVTVAGFSVNSLTLGDDTNTGTQTLQKGAGIISVVDPSTIEGSGQMNWQNGYLIDGTLTNNGLVRIEGGGGARGVNSSSGGTFRNEGTVEHVDTQPFYVTGSDARTENAGLWDLQSDGDLSAFSGTMSVFVNEAGGTFQKSSGVGLTTVSGAPLVFENAGTIDVQTGEVRFDRPSTHTDATLTTAAGALLRFSVGGVTFVGIQSGAQAGALQLDDAITAGAGAEWAFTGGGIRWTDGYLGTGTLTNTGLVRLNGGGGNRGILSSTGATFRNEGTVEHIDTQPFYVTGDNALAENAGLWDIQSDGDLRAFTGAMGVFVNEAGGTFQKSGGAGLTTVDGAPLVFENAGTVDVQTGEVRFDRPSTHTDATLTTAAGALLRFSTGGVTFVGIQTGAQAGTLQFDDALIAGADAEWAFTGDGALWQDGYLGTGTLTNTGLVRLNGNGGARGLFSNTGATFRNEGTVEHLDTAPFYVTGNDARTENAALWNIQSDGDLRAFTGTMGVFANETGGTFQKSGGMGLTTVGGAPLVFENAGTIDVQTGEVRFDRPSKHTDATLTTSVGALLRFSTGGVSLAGTVTGEQLGTLQLDDEPIPGANAVIAFSGTGLRWQDVYLTTGTLTNVGLVRLDGSGGSRGVNSGSGATFRNEGTVEHLDTSPFYVTGNDARTENAGLWDIQTDASNLGAFSGSMGVFVNEAGGTFQKSGGAGTTTIFGAPLVFENAGVVSVLTGEINVDRPFDHQAGGLIAGSGTFDIINSSPFTFNGDVSPGTSPGVLTWQTSFAPSATSALTVEIAGPSGPGDPAGHDQLVVTGAAALAGDLVIDVTSTAGLTVGDTFTILAASGGVTGTFASVELDGLPGPSFSVTYNANDVVLTLDQLASPLTLRGLPGWRTLATPFPDLPLGGREFGMLETIYTAGYVGAQRDQRNNRGTANVFLYDESTGAFEPPFNDAPPGGGVGFWVFVFNDDDSFTPGTQGGFPKPLQSSGTPATFPFDIPVTYTPSVVRGPGTPEVGFNLVGNPANEDIDWAELTKTNVSDVLYIYDRKLNDGDGGWRTWNGTTGTLPTEGLIPVGQGFHVETTGADPELVVPTSALLGTQSSFYRLTSGEASGPVSASKGETETLPLIRLDLDAVVGGMERTSEVFLSFEEHATLGFDSRDARLLAGTPGATVARLYARLGEAHGADAGTALQITALPTLEEGVLQIDLGAEALLEGEASDASATLSWEALALPDAWSATLTDRQTGVSYDLTQPGSADLALAAAEAKTVTDADADPTRAETLSAIEAAAALGEAPPTPKSPRARALRAVAPVASLTGSASGATRFVVEIDPLGALAGETEAGLSAVYPNPASRVARLELRLPEETEVQVGVYDVLGRRVAEVEGRLLPAGIHTVEVPVATLAPGTYVVRVDGPGLGESRRLTVAR
ncbi:MAG: T9SS type A sorting domain-containing protein [Bacteroidota bacterium]